MKKRAFTLVEMSIVLIIVGLILGGTFKVLKSMQAKAQVTNAKDDVEAAKNAIIGNALKNSNTLPPNDFFQQNLSPQKNNQHPLLYVDDSQLETIDICSFQSTKLIVNTPDRGDIKDIAFIVVSESANHNMQTIQTGNTLKVHSAYEANIDDNPNPVNTPDFYDDIVEWVTLSQLQQQLKCSEHSLSILNDHNLLDGLDSTPYSTSEIYADKGSPFTGDKYQWCVQYTAPDTSSINNWLETDCDGSKKQLVSNCTSSTYKSCKNFAILGKGTNNAQLGIHRVIVNVKDQANSAISKSFTIKINQDTSSGTLSTNSNGNSNSNSNKKKFTWSK